MNTRINLEVPEVSITETRRTLPSLVRGAEQGRPVRLTRNGKPTAVLIGHREFEQLASGPRDFAEAYEDFLKSYPLEDPDIDPDEVFRDSRDESAGRDVSL